MLEAGSGHAARVKELHSASQQGDKRAGAAEIWTTERRRHAGGNREGVERPGRRGRHQEDEGNPQKAEGGAGEEGKTKNPKLAERVMVPAIPKREDLVNKELNENFLPAHWLSWLFYGPLGMHADEDISFMSSNGPDLERLSDGDISEDDNDGGGGEFEDEDASGYASPASSLQGNSSGDTGEGTLRMVPTSNAGKSNGNKRANSSDGPSGGGRSAVKSKRVMKCLSNANEVLGRRATKERNREEIKRARGNQEGLQEQLRLAQESSAVLLQVTQQMTTVGGSGPGAAGVPTSGGVDVTEGVHGGGAGERGDVVDVDLSGGTNGNRSDNEASQETASVRAGAVQAARNHARVRGGPGSAATTGAAAKHFASWRATSSGPAAAAAAAANNAANVLAVDSSDSDADGGGNDEFVMDIDGEGCRKEASVGSSGRGCGGGSEGVGAAGGPKRPRCNKHRVPYKIMVLRGKRYWECGEDFDNMCDHFESAGGVTVEDDSGEALDASAGTAGAAANGVGVVSVSAAGGGMGTGDGTAAGGASAAAGASHAVTNGAG
ncbi:unnamed protein product [Ectocarpus sp. CCAP 1310/34]|nr:unnamed protein product [Ectocarpus sp. CCAP 1310/34]